ncbi:MAG: asparagine synthase (glutamine-hydrolyzing) [Verrucomicrobiota bacterium]|nr:asparagine synthase (glutamine-hydrolyzing) [Verrucomicrobiota bacterium]
MCGIAAHISFNGSATPLDLRQIHHRGPDSSGEWLSPNELCWLGNTRLAIMDLSPAGAQPMLDPFTGNVIVVNGEIYNHLELRRELDAEVPWQGTSDTETLLRCYARWGHGLLERLKGMFAFVIYDAARDEIFVARDRLGIKPLYCMETPSGMFFASEARMLVNEPQTVSASSVSSFLQWGACPEEDLLFRGVRSFGAGHAMTIGRDRSVNEWTYWPPPRPIRSPKGDAPAQVRRLLERAVDEHLLADVPVASFLSGGIDSSIITAMAAQKLDRKLQTFSVGFESEEFDETSIALQVAQRYGTEHERIQLSDEEVISSVTEAIAKLDLPSVDAINTYVVSKAVAARGVKVALSGLGGDELFGGYATFRDVPRLKLMARLPPSIRGLIGKLAGHQDRLLDLPATTETMEMARWRRRFLTDRQIASAELPHSLTLPEAAIDLPDDFARISWAELSGYMRRMLLRDSDQMSMAVSLELRVPLLDHELVEYVLGLPAVEKQRFAGTKGLLVEACRDLLPTAVFQRAKRGFVLPMREWMSGPLAEFVRHGVDQAIVRGLLPSRFVHEVKAAFEADRLHWTRLWSIVVLGQFAERHHLTSADVSTL